MRHTGLNVHGKDAGTAEEKNAKIWMPARFLQQVRECGNARERTASLIKRKHKCAHMEMLQFAAARGLTTTNTDIHPTVPILSCASATLQPQDIQGLREGTNNKH